MIDDIVLMEFYSVFFWYIAFNEYMYWIWYVYHQ